jgi:hypothetical protein
LRLANQSKYNEYDGHFEIVSITGIVSIHGSHIHVSVSDSSGHTIGGHLVEGCLIYTTCELVVLDSTAVTYKRELLPNDSGWEELVVHRK